MAASSCATGAVAETRTIDVTPTTVDDLLARRRANPPTELVHPAAGREHVPA